MGAPMSAMKYNRIQVEPLSGALGAEIHGVDLTDDLSAEVVSDLHSALMDHLVIFFRDQIMTPEQHKAFGRRFGELHIHPITEPMKGHPEIIEVIKEADELGNWGDEWHTDLTALPEPPLGSILYAKEVPPFSGDTQFSNMSFVFNLGAGAKWTIWKVLKARRFDEVPPQLMRFVNAGGRVVKGLVNRRAAV